MDAKTLRREAETNRSKASELRRVADALDAQAVELERLASLAEGTGTVLHKRLRRATVNSEMHADHRQAISRSRPGDEAFRKAIGRYTQNELAKAVGISPATLSFYRNGRKVPKKVADDVERLTGFKATGKNWPGGIHGAE